MAFIPKSYPPSNFFSLVQKHWIVSRCMQNKIATGIRYPRQTKNKAASLMHFSGFGPKWVVQNAGTPTKARTICRKLTGRWKVSGSCSPRAKNRMCAMPSRWIWAYQQETAKLSSSLGLPYMLFTRDSNSCSRYATSKSCVLRGTHRNSQFKGRELSKTILSVFWRSPFLLTSEGQLAGNITLAKFVRIPIDLLRQNQGKMWRGNYRGGKWVMLTDAPHISLTGL